MYQSKALDEPPVPDGALLALFLEHRDNRAFAELVRRHQPMVSSVCHRLLSDRGHSEDAVQATFLVLAQKAAAVRKRDSVSSWLYGVAVRVSSRIRAKVMKSPRALAPDEIHDCPGPLSDPVWRETVGILNAELAHLPDRYRAPLVECYLNGKSRDEVAAALGVSLDVLRGRLQRGRERLKRNLERRGVTLTTAGMAALLADAALGPGGAPAQAAGIAEIATQFASTEMLTSGPAVQIAQIVLREFAMRKLKFTLLSLLLASGLLGSLALAWTNRETVDQPNDRKELLGRWSLIEVQNPAVEPSADERQALADGKYKIEITADHFIFPNRNKGKYQLNQSRSPYRLRVEPERTSSDVQDFFELLTEGKSSRARVGHAIYELRGDTLRICWGWAGKTPSGFDIKQEPPSIAPSLWILRRDPPAAP